MRDAGGADSNSTASGFGWGRGPKNAELVAGALLRGKGATRLELRSPRVAPHPEGANSPG